MRPRRKFDRLDKRKAPKSRPEPGSASRKDSAKPIALRQARLLAYQRKPPSEAQRRFGQRIRELRRKIALELPDFARRCDIALLKMERIEAGEVSVCLPTILLLAQQLGVRSYELFLTIDGNEFTIPQKDLP